MPTWHIMMVFQVPRGAEITGEAVDAPGTPWSTYFMGDRQ